MEDSLSLEQEESNGTVLVIDDEEELRQIIVFKCHKLGYETMEARNGIDALETLSSEKIDQIDIILSDLSMPLMDGIDLLKSCRKKQINLPFLFLTGNGSRRTLHHALRMGAFDYIEKPFNNDQMAPLLHAAVSESMRLERGHDNFKEPNEDEHGFPNIDFSSESLESFLSSSGDQIQFGKSTVEGLLHSQDIPRDVGFLFRITRDIANNANRVGCFDIADLASHLTETFIYYRTQPNSLDEDGQKVLNLSFEGLHDMIQSLDDQKSNSSKHRKARTSISSHKLSLYRNSTLK